MPCSRRRAVRSRATGRPTLIAHRESSFLRPDRLAAALAVALFLTSWALLHAGFYAREQIVDTPVYERYGEAVAAGEVPYRDFPLEYPPAALAVFVLPALGDGDYRARFEGLMATCGVALILLLAASRALGAAAFVGVAPLLLGSVILTRFDLWPTALMAGALMLVLARRNRLGAGVLGIAAAAKLYPAVLLPIVLAAAWRSGGRREAAASGAAFAAVFGAVVLPFLAVSPTGVWDAVWTQAVRPLQVESLGSALLLAAHHVAGVDVAVDSSHGSQNLTGGAAAAIAVATTLAQLAALAVIWTWFARGPADRDRTVRAAAAAVAAFVAFGKVLSPQFLIWLVPLVPLVRGRRGFAATALLAAALVATQLWFPYRYWELVLELDGGVSALVLVRGLALVALVAVLTLPARAERARTA